MAVSNVSIANAALRKLGESPITDFNENSKAARLANERFEEVRDALLHTHPWNFAMKRVSLAASATGPEWGFENAFPVPADYIRAFEINNENLKNNRWQAEDGTIVTDLPAPLEIRYVYQLQDPTRMSPGFREALADALAADWAHDITGDPNIMTETAGRARLSLARAKSSDGQEGTPKQMNADEWINARF